MPSGTRTERAERSDRAPRRELCSGRESPRTRPPVGRQVLVIGQGRAHSVRMGCLSVVMYGSAVGVACPGEHLSRLGVGGRVAAGSGLFVCLHRAPDRSRLRRNDPAACTQVADRLLIQFAFAFAFGFASDLEKPKKCLRLHYVIGRGDLSAEGVTTGTDHYYKILRERDYRSGSLASARPISVHRSAADGFSVQDTLNIIQCVCFYLINV